MGGVYSDIRAPRLHPLATILKSFKYMFACMDKGIMWFSDAGGLGMSAVV